MIKMTIPRDSLYLLYSPYKRLRRNVRGGCINIISLKKILDIEIFNNCIEKDKSVGAALTFPIQYTDILFMIFR